MRGRRKCHKFMPQSKGTMKITLNAWKLVCATACAVALAATFILTSSPSSRERPSASMLRNEPPPVSPKRRRLLNWTTLVKDPKTVIPRNQAELGNLEKPKFAVLLTSSDGFFDLWMNWLIFFERLAIPDLPVYLFAEDEVTHKRCMKLLMEPRESKYRADIMCLPWDFVFEINEESKKLGHFRYGSEEYKVMMTRRPTVVKRLLGLGRHIIFSDTDVVWLHNPVTYIEGVFMNDAPLVHISGQNDKKRICAGFVVYRSCPEVLTLIDQWQEHLWKGDPTMNQVPFNQILGVALTEGLSVTLPDGTTENRNITASFLPGKLFPVGIRYFEEMTEEERKNAMIVHGNYIVGYEEKIKRFKEFDLWALN